MSDSYTKTIRFADGTWVVLEYYLGEVCREVWKDQRSHTHRNNGLPAIILLYGGLEAHYEHGQRLYSSYTAE